jgi:hypothetical protein
MELYAEQVLFIRTRKALHTYAFGVVNIIITTSPRSGVKHCNAGVVT